MFPSVFSAAAKGYDRAAVQDADIDKPGAFTISHAAGYGLLYQLTGEKVACGKDFISSAPNGQWVTLRLVMEVLPVKGAPQWMDRKSSAGPGYGDENI